MREIYIYHHLGLGDHITCHGIVRTYCENYDRVNLFVKEHNYDNVSYMYNDINNLNLIVGNDVDVVKYINDNNIKNVRYIGFNLNNWENLELQFYRMAGTPIEYKRKKFFINRDLDKEIQIFNELKLEKNNYIFLHKGDYEINHQYITPGLKIVEPKTHDFFDWIYVIENAKEIHCIDSSFLCLIDNLQLNEDIKLFNHRYVRNYPDWIKIYEGKKWIEIK